MKSHTIHFLLALVLMSSSALAQEPCSRTSAGEISFSEGEQNLRAVLHCFFRKTKTNFLSEGDIPRAKEKVHLAVSQPLSLEAAWELIYQILHDAGYNLVTNTDLNIKEVVKERMAKQLHTKVHTEIEKVEPTYRYQNFVFRTKFITSDEMARNIRMFIGRDARIVSEENANLIIISDTGKNIHRIQDIMKRLDVPSAAPKKEKPSPFSENIEKEIKIEQQSDLQLSRYDILFLLVFLMVGFLVGFTLRGYVIRRIEGGF